MNRFATFALMMVAFVHLSLASEMFQEGMTWTVSHRLMTFSGISENNGLLYSELTVEGDTVIDGIKAKVMRYNYHLPLPDEFTKEWFEIGYERDGQVWIYSHALKDFHQVMDFNLKPGDHFKDRFEVRKVFTQNIYGKDRKIIELSESMGRNRFYWIEGIGTTCDICMDDGTFHSIHLNSELAECSLNGELLFATGCIRDPDLRPERVRMVVPGRTWWYEGRYRESMDEWIEPWTVFGMRLESRTEYKEGEPLNCYLIGKDGQSIFDFPLAQLREEDGRVWVRPTEGLDGLSAGTDLDPLTLFYLQRYLGFWNGFRYKEQYNDLLWADEDSDQEFLLYDFNMEVGDSYHWPWAGCNAEWDDEESGIRARLEKGYFIGNITACSLNGGTIVREFHLKQIEKGKSVATGPFVSFGSIIEGIGIVGRGDRKYGISFVPGLDNYMGYCICPIVSSTYQEINDLKDWMNNNWNPDLKCVREADGSCIYGDRNFMPSQSGVWSLKPVRPQGGQLYDLQGRPLSEPARGQLYVRDGKLQFAK